MKPSSKVRSRPEITHRPRAKPGRGDVKCTAAGFRWLSRRRPPPWVRRGQTAEYTGRHRSGKEQIDRFILGRRALSPDSRLILLSVGFSALGVIWSFFSIRIAIYPDNHVGFDPHLAMIPLFSVLLIALKLLASAHGDRSAQVMLVLSLLSLLGLVLLRSFHVLLPYELWLTLGMPDRPF